jgi:hypothetical protein
MAIWTGSTISKSGLAEVFSAVCGVNYLHNKRMENPEYRAQYEARMRAAAKRRRQEREALRAEIQFRLDIYSPGTKADLRKHKLPKEPCCECRCHDDYDD